MPITALTIKLILLFLPGIISRLIVEALTSIKEKRLFYFVVFALILGFANYLVYALSVTIYNWLPFITNPVKVYFFVSLSEATTVIDYQEIFSVCLVSIILGLFFSKAINNSWLHRFARKLKISRTFADADVWGYIFNSDDIGWITVRDLKNGLVYQGWVSAFSERHGENELLLKDVRVFRDIDEEELYSTAALYIHRDKGDITIDFPTIEHTEHTNKEES